MRAVLCKNQAFKIYVVIARRLLPAELLHVLASTAALTRLIQSPPLDRYLRKCHTGSLGRTAALSLSRALVRRT